MNPRLGTHHSLLSGVFALACFCQTAAADNETVLPGNGFPASRYESLWSKSPFSVASADGSGPASPDYSLVGIAEFDGISYASIIDKKNNQEHFLLSSAQDAHGLKLVSVTRGANADDTSAVVQRNGESLTLKLDTTTNSTAGGNPVVATAPAPVLQMPGSVPGPASFRPYTAPGQPPPVTYRPRMISIPSPPGQFHNFPFHPQMAPSQPTSP